MALSTSLTTTFLKEMMDGTNYDFSSGTSSVFKCALYDSDASIDYSTTAYSATDEVSGTGYTAGGEALTVATNPTVDGRRVYLTFSNLTFSTVTLSDIRYGLVYLEDGVNDYSILAIDFDTAQSRTGANFVLEFPTDMIELVAGV